MAKENLPELRSVVRFLDNRFFRILPFLLVFAVFDVCLSRSIGVAGETRAGEYFLPVGQGDSELLVMDSGVKILIDGGPVNSLVVQNLDKIMAPHDKYIDVVILTHPELDHFGGLADVFKSYRVGAFASNGLGAGTGAYGNLENLIAVSGAKTVTLGAGDAVKNGGNLVRVLSPRPAEIADSSINDAALVLEVTSGGITSLLASDISSSVERKIIPFVGEAIDVLKVAHHGSKDSSSGEFLAAVKPEVAVIEVGKNSYGHPSPEAVERLTGVVAALFRTDEAGLLKISRNENGRLEVFRMK